MLRTFNHRLARPPPMIGSEVNTGVIFTPSAARSAGFQSAARVKGNAHLQHVVLI